MRPELRLTRCLQWCRCRRFAAFLLEFCDTTAIYDSNTIVGVVWIDVINDSNAAKNIMLNLTPKVLK